VRVRLRPAEDADLAWVAAIARDPRVAPALALGAADELPGAIARGELLVDAERRGAARLVVTVARHGLASIRTVVVDPDRHGAGVGLALVRALVDEAFTARGLHRLEAEVYAYNTPGLRLFERAGFTRDGVRRQAWERHGAWQDGVIYGLLSTDPR
jgi:ribosomal protein S18 acetylase RimI-like enzyme